MKQLKNFLIKHKIGVCDIVDSCERTKIDASDIGMQNIQLRNLIGYLKQYPSVHTLLFTGGNSKNGPEYFFRKHLKDYGLKLELVSNETPKVHSFNLSCHAEPVEASLKNEILHTPFTKTNVLSKLYLSLHHQVLQIELLGVIHIIKR